MTKTGEQQIILSQFIENLTQDEDSTKLRQSAPKNCNPLHLTTTRIVCIGMVIVLVILGHTQAEHLQGFWSLSGGACQGLWEKIYDWFDGDAKSLFVWGTYFSSSIPFWIINFLFICLDWTGRPNMLLKYKIQMNKNRPVDTKRLGTVVFVVFINMTALTIPVLYMEYYLFSWRGCTFGRELPKMSGILIQFIIFLIALEVTFYYIHRISHWSPIYKSIHRFHHEWTAPISISALYSHPLEHIFSTLLSVGIGPFLCGSHVAVVWIWYQVALLSTTISHCGYHFPLLPSSEFHDFHHVRLNSCFGVLGVLDRLHGTDLLFWKMPQSNRHFVLFGLTPLSKQYPDNLLESI